MAILVSAHQLRKAYAARPLFDNLTFAIESGERVGLIGPNGAGKSTLLRILANQSKPDDGTLSLQRGLRVGYLEQVPTFKDDEVTILASILEGTEDPYDWECISRAQEYLSKLSLDGPGLGPDVPVSRLSGGWRKRVALARELARLPDLLLMDEPTNHLDVESIVWLEDLLSHAKFASLIISHDRLFLQRTVNRIVELDRRNPGGLLSVQGDYATYLEIKEQNMAAQERREVILKNTLRRETEWLRQGAKARTTKQQARIQRQGELQDTVDELGYRNTVRTARLDFQATERSPQRLVDARKISKSYGDRQIFSGVELLVTPGTRIGLLGANGCGKTTLIRVLLGKEQPDRGTVLRADNLKVAYFEQNRDALDPNLTVSKTLCPKGDHVDFRGSRVHIRSYLDRFLFSQSQMDMTVGKLSGGEQSRLLIAQLMLQEANLLVLDEPTNDLDFATLAVLEECLTDFNGAVLLVTHDRYFLDQVCTQILAFDQNSPKGGEIISFMGLSQWEAWHSARGQTAKPTSAVRSNSDIATVVAESAGKKRKLSFKEQREYDQMEDTIKRTERELEEMAVLLALPATSTNAKKLQELTQAMGETQAKIDKLYARWAELEG